MKTRYRKMIIFFWVACQVVAFSLLFPTHVYADDCLTDPLNAADCMRTPGFRQGTSVVISVAGTLATILVTVLGGAAATASAVAATGGAAATAQTTAGAITGAPAAAVTTALGFTQLGADLETINQDLDKQNIYVRNLGQGDPTLIVQGLYNLIGMGWDESVGRWTGAQGLTCGEYVDKTINPVKSAVEKQFPGAKVQSITFNEKSTLDPKGWGDKLDSINTENHNLIKLTLPDGSEWAVDFHQHNAHIMDSRKPPIMRPWNDAKKEWVEYLGKNEFMEKVEE